MQGVQTVALKPPNRYRICGRMQADVENITLHDIFAYLTEHAWIRVPATIRADAHAQFTTNRFDVVWLLPTAILYYYF